MPDTVPSNRTKLVAALAAVTAAQSELAELSDARERAREKSWELTPRVEAAEAALTQAHEDEPRLEALAYTRTDVAFASPVPPARETLTRLQEEAARIDRVRAALDVEIEAAQNDFRALQADLYRELGAVVTQSDSYRGLCADHKNLWTQLRTCRETLKTIHAALHGAVSQEQLEAAQRAEPLEIRIGYSVNQEFIAAWREALAELLKDPENAELP
jgi:chromosome segregation ATPase